MSELSITTITECQIKALVVVLDSYIELATNSRNVIDAQAFEDATDLLHKLEFANDGKLRLSGRMRVIDIKRDDEEPEWKGVYPGMCVNPNICKGKTHCPRNYSCCE